RRRFQLESHKAPRSTLLYNSPRQECLEKIGSYLTVAVRKEFLTRINMATEEANQRADFYVLVWGSGKGNVSAFRKRSQIKDALENEFGHGCVFFSEDKDLRDFTKREGVIRSELEQLKSVNF